MNISGADKWEEEKDKVLQELGHSAYERYCASSVNPYYYRSNLHKYRVICKNRIIDIESSDLFKENSQEYTIARINKLERRFNRGFFARIFNR